MENSFKTRIKRLIIFFILGFTLLFLFRLGYGYTLNVGGGSSGTDFFSRVNDIRRNYASEKFKFKKGYSGSTQQQSLKLDQKYEKVATVKSKSGQFADDEKKVKQKIQDYNGIIQFENNSGNKGNRKLHLLIGIQPEKFETVYKELLTIGKILAKEITKKDKTNEYKQLNAQISSLEKIRTSLLELKAKGGKIEEYINLENRILEIEEQLQGLGVQLGNYDEENEFCTVRFSLIEGKEVQISFMHRIKVALEWTTKTYLMMVFSLFMVTIMSFILVLILDKLKVFSKVVDNLNKE